MNISNFMFGVQVGHSEGLIELVSITQVFDDCID